MSAATAQVAAMVADGRDGRGRPARAANTKQFAELLKTVGASSDDDTVAAGMGGLKWRAVVALTRGTRAGHGGGAFGGRCESAGSEDFVKDRHSGFDDIRAMPRPLRRHLLDARQGAGDLC